MQLPSAENHEDLLRKCLYISDRTSDVISIERTKWMEYYKLYRSYINQQIYPFRNQMFIPFTFGLIQTILPRAVAGLLYKYPLVEVLPAHPLTTQDSVLAVSSLLNDKWFVDPQTWYDKLMMFQESLMYGTAGYKLYHSKIRQRVPKWSKPLEFNGVPTLSQKYMQTMLLENRPRMDHIDIFDIYPDLMHRQNPEFVAHVKLLSMDELRGSEIHYEHLDDMENDGAFTDTQRDGDFRLLRLTSVESNYPDKAYDINEMRLVQEFCVKEHTNKGLMYRLITIGNRKYIMRDEYIPYWPWRFVQNNPNPHEMLGVSEIESIRTLQHGHNFNVNMLLDNNLLAMTKMWAFGEAANPDLDNFVVEPGGILMVDDISQFKEIAFTDIPPKAWDVLELFPAWMQQAVGINDYLQGANPPRREFASTVSLLQQASEARIDLKIKMFEKFIVQEMARGFVDIAQHELDEPEYVYRKQTNDFEQFTAYNLQGLFDYNVSSTSMGMSEIARQQLNDFADVAGKLMGPETPLQARIGLLQAIGRTYNSRDIGTLMNELPRMVQQQQAQQQAAAQQQATQQQSQGQTPPNGGNPPGNQSPIGTSTPNGSIPGLAQIAAAGQGVASQQAR